MPSIGKKCFDVPYFVLLLPFVALDLVIIKGLKRVFCKIIVKTS